MIKIQWWLRIVGVLYLLFGLLNVINGLDIGQHTETLSWLVLGGVLLFYSRETARAGILVVTIALLELLVWIPVTVALVLSAMSLALGGTFIILHFVIGVSGLLFLRQAAMAHDKPL